MKLPPFFSHTRNALRAAPVVVAVGAGLHAGLRYVPRAHLHHEGVHDERHGKLENEVPHCRMHPKLHNSLYMQVQSRQTSERLAPQKERKTSIPEVLIVCIYCETHTQQVGSGARHLRQQE